MKTNLTQLRKKNGKLFVKEPADIRFHRAISKIIETGCWEWNGARHYKGYGEFMVEKGRKMKVHRYSWELHNGKIPDGKMVLHQCDNPPCCNPAHLFLGDAKSNRYDCDSKGRGVFGERCHTSKITADQVVEIRNMDKIKGVSRMSIARKYGVSGRNITAICRHDSWKHIP